MELNTAYTRVAASQPAGGRMAIDRDGTNQWGGCAQSRSRVEDRRTEAWKALSLSLAACGAAASFSKKTFSKKKKERDGCFITCSFSCRNSQCFAIEMGRIMTLLVYLG